MAEERLLAQFGRAWWLVTLRGVAAVVFGGLAFIWPGMTILALILVWGAYAIADGVLALIAAYRVRERGRPMLALLLIGVLGLAAGIVAFIWPGLTALALLLLIAAWAFVMGIFQIAAAIRLRREIRHEWLLALSGALSVAFAALLVVNPGAGALALLWVIAVYAIVFGALLIALGLRLKGMAPRGELPAAAPRPH
jgi:uncharacterized membrane protein HdeD (DUF308 family)